MHEEVTGDVRYNLAQKLYEQIPNKAEFEDLPKDIRHNSENIGAPRLTRKTSRRLGDVPGFGEEIGTLSKQKAQEKFRELLFKFMRLWAILEY